MDRVSVNSNEMGLSDRLRIIPQHSHPTDSEFSIYIGMIDLSGRYFAKFASIVHP